jgi:MgtC family
MLGRGIATAVVRRLRDYGIVYGMNGEQLGNAVNQARGRSREDVVNAVFLAGIFISYVALSLAALMVPSQLVSWLRFAATPDQASFVVRILHITNWGLLLGGCVGWGRGRLGKTVGVRTCAILTAAVAGIAFVGAHAFPQGDPTRVLSTIATALATFVAAGVIWRTRDAAEGLTTGAAVFALCCIGEMLGAEWTMPAGAVTMATILVLDIARPLSHKEEPLQNS